MLHFCSGRLISISQEARSTDSHPTPGPFLVPTSCSWLANMEKALQLAGGQYFAGDKVSSAQVSGILFIGTMSSAGLMR